MDHKISSSKDWMSNPQFVKIESVDSVLGKWEVALHFQSGLWEKNFHTFFSYKWLSLDETMWEVSKYKVEPKIFHSPYHVARYMRERSLFVTDTYVVQLPWEVFVVYQLSNIRFLQEDIINTPRTRAHIFSILSNDKSEGWPSDKSLYRKLDLIWFDDDRWSLWDLDGLRTKENFPNFPNYIFIDDQRKSLEKLYLE